MRPYNPRDPNVEMLEVVAQCLGPALCDELVFVGGAAVGLLITDPAQPAIRPTEDVDLLAQVVALPAYHLLEHALRAKGFTPDLKRDAPICRWTVQNVTVDVMPTLPSVLGFSNRWYPLAAATATPVHLPSGTEILLISAPAFVATKLEAFHGRGRGDFLFSHDMGDIVSLVDGRAELLAECEQAPADLRHYIGEQMVQLLGNRAFRESLVGHLPGDAASQARLPDLEDKLRLLAACKQN